MIFAIGYPTSYKFGQPPFNAILFCDTRLGVHTETHITANNQCKPGPCWSVTVSIRAAMVGVRRLVSVFGRSTGLKEGYCRQVPTKWSCLTNLAPYMHPWGKTSLIVTGNSCSPGRGSTSSQMGDMDITSDGCGYCVDHPPSTTLPSLPRKFHVVSTQVPADGSHHQ